MGDDSLLKGVANSFVFKSRLQEYAQKTGAMPPDYETVKEGPSHEPIFRSAVIFNGTRYESLPGFFNRKMAEQSAAEVALIDLEKSGKLAEFMPTYESGLCKNLLQEYAQKMNYALPLYTCRSKNTGKLSTIICTVEIGGIQYVGAAASTKKEAEIKAARTALVAINSPLWGQGRNRDYQYSVLPGKKASSSLQNDSVKKFNPKKALMKRNWRSKKFLQKNVKLFKGGRSRSDHNGQHSIETKSEVNGYLVGDQ